VYPPYKMGMAGKSFGGRRVLCDSLGALRHGMLGQFTREDQADRCLDFSGRDRRLLVVDCQFGRFCRNALEDVVHKGVQDRHCAVGDTSVRVDLLEHLVNVGRVGLLPGLRALLLVARGCCCLLAGFFFIQCLGGGGGLGPGLLGGRWGCHFLIWVSGGRGKRREGYIKGMSSR